jgi:hypothetical protein
LRQRSTDIVEIALGSGEDDHTCFSRAAAYCPASGSPQVFAAGFNCVAKTCQVAAELGEGRQLRYCARSAAPPAIDFMALVCALPPTRLTEIPTLMAGRWLS